MTNVLNTWTSFCIHTVVRSAKWRCCRRYVLRN